jgi:hypothetical protein
MGIIGEDYPTLNYEWRCGRSGPASVIFCIINTIINEKSKKGIY